MKLHFAPAFRLAAVVVGAAIGSQSAHAAINVSVEAAGVQASTRSNLTTEDFNSRTLGTFTSLGTSIGSYSAADNHTAIILAPTADGGAYGGANNTQYVSVGAQAGNTGGTMVLSLNGPANYFGLWWAAMDSQNILKIYSGGVGGTLLGTYTAATMASYVTGSGYNGNPNNGLNTNEKYAYVNFDGTAGTTFDTITFTNSSSTGFESDNHSIRSVPEPSALAMGAAASVLGLALARRRARNA